MCFTMNTCQTWFQLDALLLPVFSLLSADGSLQQKKKLWMCTQRLKGTTLCLFIHFLKGEMYNFIGKILYRLLICPSMYHG